MNKIEVIDKDESITCQQKIESLNSMKNSFENIFAEKIAVIRSMKDNISPFVDTYDTRQAADQVCQYLTCLK